MPPVGAFPGETAVTAKSHVAGAVGEAVDGALVGVGNCRDGVSTDPVIHMPFMQV